jgi:hypothetical protein
MPIGVYVHKKGYKRPPEIGLKVSLAKKGKPNGLLGKKRSEAIRINISNGKLKNGTITKFGYRIISVNRKRIYEHRHIWIINNGDIPLGYQIHHLNGDKLDNKIENLECISINDHGRMHGSMHGKSKKILCALK